MMSEEVLEAVMMSDEVLEEGIKNMEPSRSEKSKREFIFEFDKEKRGLLLKLKK